MSCCSKPFYAWPESIWDTLYQLLDLQDIQIILAHAERYPAADIEQLARDGVPAAAQCRVPDKAAAPQALSHLDRRRLRALSRQRHPYARQRLSGLGEMCKAAGKESAMKQDTLTGAADKQPLVSVIMPAYNAEKYIGEAIASVCAQTYKNWNLLILDDGSADRTVEIAESYAQQDARIQVLCNPQNMGVARTRNRGFDLAQGEWIALLDSDDRWRAQKLEKQLAVAEEFGCGYCLLFVCDDR